MQVKLAYPASGPQLVNVAALACRARFVPPVDEQHTQPGDRSDEAGSGHFPAQPGFDDMDGDVNDPQDAVDAAVHQTRASSPPPPSPTARSKNPRSLVEYLTKAVPVPDEAIERLRAIVDHPHVFSNESYAEQTAIEPEVRCVPLHTVCMSSLSHQTRTSNSQVLPHI